uniref:Uncharacterized protein n=1 Tax=Seriola dumerili TaxID=41447 RepID=A0A3B4VDK8_SERDU
MLFYFLSSNICEATNKPDRGLSYFLSFHLISCLYFFILSSSPCVFVGQLLGCHQGQWQCDDGNCIPDVWRCDGDGDCLDGSDEMDCENCTTTYGCLNSDWTCRNHMCIPKDCVNRNLVCDGRSHCRDGSDEVDCPTVCVLYSHVCDGENDCKDGSDEEGCGKFPKTKSHATVLTMIPARPSIDSSNQMPPPTTPPAPTVPACSSPLQASNKLALKCACKTTNVLYPMQGQLSPQSSSPVVHQCRNVHCCVGVVTVSHI